MNAQFFEIPFINMSIHIRIFILIYVRIGYVRNRNMEYRESFQVN